jgi:Ca2+-binding RTX toxin-like protein
MAAPTLTITCDKITLKAGETAAVTFTFSEPPMGFSLGDVSVTGGTISLLESTTDPLIYEASFTPTAGVAAGAATISVGNASYTNAAGDDGQGASGPSLTIQTLRPSATVVVADAALRIGETSLVTITFSEAVSGFSNADLTVANGTLSAVASSDGGVTWEATFAPSANVTDASNVITLDMSGVMGASGNAGAGTSDSGNYAVDTARPTATVALADPALGIGQTSNVTFTFSEAVVGFTNADLMIDNGALSAVSSSDGGLSWTATFTPAAGVNDNSNVILVDMTGVADLAGNAGSGTVNSSNYVVDHQRPVATVNLADPELKAGETSLVTVTFSEAVIGFTIDDLSTPNGALTAMSSGDGGITWTATFTPGASVRDYSNVIGVDNTGYADLAGNAGALLTYSANFTIDTVRPTATVVVDATALKADESSDVTITFSEAVNGFDRADLTVGNGTLTNPSSTDGGVTWTATLTPNASVSAASNVITLDLTGVANGIGNAGTGSAVSGNYEIDTARPSATSIIVGNPTIQAGQTTLVTIEFSEPVVGFGLSDLSVDNGVLSNLATSDNKTWTATLTPTVGVSDATNLILLDSSLVTDDAGNAGIGISISNNYAVGHVPPQPASDDDVIALPADGGSVSAGPGNDSVSGAGGADLIQGNTGDDTLSGADGDDILRGGQDNDFVHGNAGADLLFGDLGNDSVFGGQGDDFVQGGLGNDYVLGDLGRDSVLGGQGGDTVFGGAGDDYLSGDLGDDVLMGGVGADLFNFSGGGGRDVVMDFSQADGDRIRISPADAADFAALSAKLVTEGGDTVIDLGGQTIVLAGVAKSALTAADFVFA